MIPSLKPLLLISIPLILLLLTAGCTSESRIGKVVPCSNYHIVSEKIRAIDNSGQIHYYITDTGNHTFEVLEISPFLFQLGPSERYWNAVPIGVQGTFGGQLSTVTMMSLIPENVTPLSEGNNFCEVVP